MKKSLFAVLSLLLIVALCAMPLVVSASTAVEEIFDPVTTQWYSVDFVRTSASKASDDAYVYTWIPAADGEFTLEADTSCKDALVTLTNKTNTSDKGITLKYYPKGGFSSADGVTCNVKGGNKYEVSVMTCSEVSGTVDFFAYYFSSSASGLKGAGTEADPYILDGSIKNLPSTKKGQTVYYLLSADKTKKFDLTVKGKDSKDSFDLYVENISSTVKSSNGAAKAEFVTPFTASGYILFSIKNNNSGAGGGYSYSIREVVVSDTKGTFDDPDVLVLDKETDANITDVCYYYTYTASEDGTLIVYILSKDNWVCSVSGGEAESLYYQASDDVVKNPLEYNVKAGEEISLWFATESFGRGTVSFKAMLAGEIQQTTAADVTTVPETEPTKAEPVTTEPVEETTAVTDTPVETKPVATEPEENTTQADDVTEATEPSGVKPEESLPQQSTPAETLPAEPDNGTDPEATFEELYDKYCLSSVALTVGENKITTSKDFPVTLFVFTPSEFAQYKFTASDANAIVGAYAGSVIYIPDSAVGTSNEATLEFTSGVDIIVGVTNTSACTLTVEKAGDIVIEEEVDWTIYENKCGVTKYETSVDPAGLASVFVYDNIANSAVLGSDGYYHLDSAEGEILYADLNSKLMSLVKIVDRGKLSAVYYDENGKVKEKIDYTQAVLKYIENSAQVVNGDEVLYLYPLTEDLITMYITVGETSDWFGRQGWVGGIAEDAWMFACCYEGEATGGVVIPRPPVVPSRPSAIPTGQSNAVVYAAVVLMLSSAVAVAVIRKKSKG